MSKLSEFFSKKYAHAIMLAYFPFYTLWFGWLNVFTPQRAAATEIHSQLDGLIPFCELFVIPYFLWFAYIAAGYVFLFFNNRSDYLRMCSFLYIGMTVCLIIYTVFPNYQALRVDYNSLGRSNFLTEAIRLLQTGDTPYNVFPSIHCLNSIGMNIALAKNEWCKKHPSVIAGVTVLTTLICLSTVFVKQHSFLDLIGAVVLSVPLYLISYKVNWKRIFQKSKEYA